jgi:hypothetical protein
MKALIQICVAAALLPFSTMNVFGWEATYPRGPVRSSPKPLLTLFSPHQPDLRDMQAIGYAPLVGNVKAPGYQPPPSGAFDGRTIAYPAKEGANLGVGWDFGRQA